MWLGVAIAVLVSVPHAHAQPGSDDPPLAGSGDLGAGSTIDPGAGSAIDPGAGSAIDPGAGSAIDPGAGSPGAGSPGAGSAIDPGAGSAAGSGAGSAAAGSGSGAPPKIIIQIPDNVTPPVVSASASPSNVRLGAVFTLFVEAAYGAGIEVNMREPVELGSAFEVRKKLSVADRVRPDGMKVREWQLAVIAWELGDIQVPELGITFTAGGKAGQVATNAVPLKVTGVLGDADDPKLMRGLAPPNELISRDWFWLWVAGGAAAAMGAIGIVVWLRSRRRGTNSVLTGGAITVSRRIDSTSERALQRLLAIERSGVLDDDERRREGYAEMVDVIREYLGTRYQVATRDLTTSELLRSLLRVAPVDERATVARWLERCDFVKYGGSKPIREAAHGTLEEARALVVATTTLRNGASASLGANHDDSRAA